MIRYKNFILMSVVAVLLFSSCVSKREQRNRIYMPDMFYSRAYETYTSTLYLKRQGIFFNARPVEGTIPRDADLPSYIANTSEGMKKAEHFENPYKNAGEKGITEGRTLYKINCMICHGEKLDGNGTLYKDGEGPFPARPATLVGNPEIEKLSDGNYYYVITHGKNLMGGFEQNLSYKERWLIVNYIRSEQHKNN